MNGVLDAVLVGAVLAIAVMYALYALGPRTWRRRFFGAGAAKAGSCGGCDGCGSDAASSKPGGAADAPVEISVPVSRIGRRTGG